MWAETISRRDTCPSAFRSIHYLPLATHFWIAKPPATFSAISLQLRAGSISAAKIWAVLPNMEPTGPNFTSWNCFSACGGSYCFKSSCLCLLQVTGKRTCAYLRHSWAFFHLKFVHGWAGSFAGGLEEATFQAKFPAQSPLVLASTPRAYHSAAGSMFASHLAWSLWICSWLASATGLSNTCWYRSEHIRW